MSVFVWGSCAGAGIAKKAIEGLIEGSFPPEEISVLLRRDDGTLEKTPLRHKTAAPLGAAIGAAVGGIGMTLALLAGSADATAAGPLLGALAGAATGGYAGLYWWKKKADLPDRLPGDVVVGVTIPEGRAVEAREVLVASGASRVACDLPPRH